MKRVTLILLVLVAACSSGGTTTTTATSTSTTSSASTTHLKLRVVVAPSGLGCIDNTPTGKGKTVIAKDQTGTIIGTALMALTPNRDTCDFTGTLDIAGAPEFLTLEGDNGKFITLTAAQAQDGEVVVNVDATGAARVG